MSLWEPASTLYERKERGREIRCLYGRSFWFWEAWSCRRRIPAILRRTIQPLLHLLPRHEGVVLTSVRMVDQRGHMIYFQGKEGVDDEKGKIGIFNITFADKTFLVMPRLFPSVSRKVGRVLAAESSTMVVWRWDQIKKAISGPMNAEGWYCHMYRKLAFFFWKVS